MIVTQNLYICNTFVKNYQNKLNKNHVKSSQF